MLSRAFSLITFLILCGLTVSALAETPSPTPSSSPSTTHSADLRPAPPSPITRPPAEGDKPADLEALVKQLKELPNPQLTGGVVDAWWRAANGVLDALEKKETDPKKAQEAAEKIASQLSPGKRQDLFKELIGARFIDDPTKLRNWVFNAGFKPEKREAARQEIARRLKDANVKLVAELFHMRPEMAMLFTDKLLRAKDGKEAGPIMAKLMGTLNKVQRKALLDKVTPLKAQAREKGLNEKLVKWLADAGAKSLGQNVAADPFVDAFDKSYQDVLKDNQRFHQLVKAALGSDKNAAAAAKRALLAEYDPESVMDFIGAQLKAKNDGVAVDTARAFAKDDGQGNLTLQASARNAGFGDKDQEQALFLGNKDKLDEIRAALHAFSDGAEHTAGEITKDFDAGTKDRFHFFGVQDPAASQANPKRLFAEAKAGRPVLSVTDKPGRPAGRTLATETIEVPSTIPQAPDLPSPSPTPGGQPPAGGNDAAAIAIAMQTCNGCHRAGNSKGGFQFTEAELKNPAAAKAKIQRMAARLGEATMPDGNAAFRDTPDGQKLLAWLRSKQ